MICPVCQSTQNDFLREIVPFKTYLCRTCKLRFSSPMDHPGQSWYEESSIYEEVEWNVPSPSKMGQRWEFKKALDFMIAPHKKVLDIGCGRGDFLIYAQSHGMEGHGIDLNEALIRVAQEQFGLKNVSHTTIEKYLESNRYDAVYDNVTAFEVLEHLPRPKEFIQNCHRLLKEGGKIVVSVPGYHRMPHWVNSEVDSPPHHLTLWSDSALRILLENVGFKNILVLRKPLLIGDVMYHVVRIFSFTQKPGYIFKLMRGGLKILVYPFFLFLKMWPSSGGFTYLATGEK